MTLDNNTLLKLFQNGHRAIEGVKFGRCQFCGLAQNYWNKWKCIRLKSFDQTFNNDDNTNNCESPGYC